VKDQYFGDVNDYIKYGLLRCLSRAGIGVGVCWMLTPNDQGTDEGNLPAATRATHAALKASAERLVNHYLNDYGDDLQRVWAVERPFELHLPNALVSARSDVILDEEGGTVSSLAIVDYKAAADHPYDYDFQLQVYTDAGRREGLTVRAAYVHDLKAESRSTVDVSQGTVEAAEKRVVTLIDRLRAKQFTASPDREKCSQCDVRPLCRESAAG
jgi:DNA helicase II / ATP-dependent DNA helicase PcrA